MIDIKELKKEDEVKSYWESVAENNIDNIIISEHAKGKKWAYVMGHKIFEECTYDLKKKLEIILSEKYLKNGIEFKYYKEGCYYLNWGE